MRSLADLSCVNSSEPAHSAVYQNLKCPPHLWPLSHKKRRKNFWKSRI